MQLACLLLLTLAPGRQLGLINEGLDENRVRLLMQDLVIVLEVLICLMALVRARTEVKKWPLLANSLRLAGGAALGRDLLLQERLRDTGRSCLIPKGMLFRGEQLNDAGG